MNVEAQQPGGSAFSRQPHSNVRQFVWKESKKIEKVVRFGAFWCIRTRHDVVTREIGSG